MEKKITVEQLREATSEAGINFDAISSNRLTIKKLKELLDQYPDEMLVGFKYKHNDEIYNHTSNCHTPLSLSEGKISYSGFDGNHSYEGLTQKTVPFLQISDPGYTNSKFA